MRWQPEIHLSKINWMLHKDQEPRAITIHQTCGKIIKAVSVMIAQSMNQKWNMCVPMLIPKSILSTDFPRIGFVSFTVKRSFPEWWKLLTTMGATTCGSFSMAKVSLTHKPAFLLDNRYVIPSQSLPLMTRQLSGEWIIVCGDLSNGGWQAMSN